MNEMNEIIQPELVDRPARRRRIWVSVLLGLVIFASGVIVGGGATIVGIVHLRYKGPPSPEKVSTWITCRLCRELKLNDEQTEQVKNILQQRITSLQAIRYRVQPEIDVQLDALEEQIGDVLDDRQREKWRKIFAQRRRHWAPPH